MGANATQGFAVTMFFVSFVPLAWAFAGGGILALLLFLVCLGVSVVYFLKCKPWEHRAEEPRASATNVLAKEMK